MEYLRPMFWAATNPRSYRSRLRGRDTIADLARLYDDVSAREYHPVVRRRTCASLIVRSLGFIPSIPSIPSATIRLTKLPRSRCQPVSSSIRCARTHFTALLFRIKT